MGVTMRGLVEIDLPEPRLPMLDEPRTRPVLVTCPVCHELWQSVVGSRFPCHGRCLFDEHSLAMIRIIAEDPNVRRHALAFALGMSRPALRNILEGRWA